VAEAWRAELIAPVTNLRILENYASGVESGNIVASKAVIAAVARYRSDLLRQDTEEFPYVFNTHAAEQACGFFPAALRHSVGEWAGQPFYLSPWQIFCIANIFGWKRADGTRRFRRSHISVARKSGKSTMAAGIGLCLLYGDAEPIAQVFIGATKMDQAKIIYDEAERMLRQSPHLMKRSEIYKNNIVTNGSFLRPLGSDKAFDGLNPHGVLFDELHEWKEHHRKFYDTMTTGGASRTQPLQVTITTAGDQSSLIWQEETAYCRQVVMGDHKDETIFVYLAELDADDDPFDEDVWEKANPNLGVSVHPEYLREQAAQAKAKKTARNRFIRYHCNREVSSISSVIDRDKWDACSGQLSDWSTADIVAGGIDIGGGFDLGASAFCARWLHSVKKVNDNGEDREVNVYRYEIASRAYIDAKSERDTSVQPWASWLHEGNLIKSEWLLQELRDDFHDEAKLIGATTFAFDPWNCKLLAEQLAELGMEAVEMPQRAAQYGEPIEQFLEALADGRVTHDGNDPVLRWCALNLSVKAGYGGGWMPDRKTSRDKIDAIVAVLMAFRMAYFAREETYWTPDIGVSL